MNDTNGYNEDLLVYFCYDRYHNRFATEKDTDESTVLQDKKRWKCSWIGNKMNACFFRLLNLESNDDEVYRRNADDDRASLQEMIIIAFHLYHKVMHNASLSTHILRQKLSIKYISDSQHIVDDAAFLFQTQIGNWHVSNSKTLKKTFDSRLGDFMSVYKRRYL
jgi:hypothetical protein